MVTVRQVYERVLIELRKYKSPHLHLDQFVYYINKGVQEFLNETYNIYDTSQQTSDALSSLSIPGTITLDWVTLSYTLVIPGGTTTLPFISGNKFGYDFVRFGLPSNYWHLLNFMVSTQTKQHYKCFPPGYLHTNYAKRLTADQKVAISNNAFLSPDLKRPYFFAQDNILAPNGIPDIEVYYGSFNALKVIKCEFDYLKKPLVLTLTVLQRDAIVDTSQSMEFPDYIVNEIIKKIVTLMLENSTDPRLQTMPLVNQSIKG